MTVEISGTGPSDALLPWLRTSRPSVYTYMSVAEGIVAQERTYFRRNLSNDHTDGDLLLRDLVALASSCDDGLGSVRRIDNPKGAVQCYAKRQWGLESLVGEPSSSTDNGMLGCAAAA